MGASAVRLRRDAVIVPPDGLRAIGNGFEVEDRFEPLAFA
jgi:hypothetical protein